MSYKRKILAAAASVTLLGGIAVTGALTAGTASASPAPLPAYPAATTLNLGSPNCVTDDVIMDDPLDSTSPITDTAGSSGAGSPVVRSIDVPPVIYFLWYLDNNTNTWQLAPPPGTQVNTVTGEVASYNGTDPLVPLGHDIFGAAAVPGTETYTVREHGKDTLGAVGTTQYQLKVNDSGGAPAVITVSYEGNDFNNANGALTIQLNGGSTTSTALTLAAIASSLNIPDVGGVGSTPVTFTLVAPTGGWKLNGGTTGTVLTGISAADPEIEAVTPDHDVVFFTLSGISTTSGGIFFTNNDVNPCVTGTPDTVSVANPGTQATTVGSAAILNIAASATDGDTVTSYSAAGLPAGLSINASTGVISGTPVTVGSNSVTVTASDNDESGSVTFTWNIVSAGSPPPSAPNYGDEVNNFGNGFDVFRQHDSVNTPIVGWPATQGDPATHFLATVLGNGNYTFQYAPEGTGTGLCVSNPGSGFLVLRGCNSSIWQQFSAVTVSGHPYVVSAVNGQVVNPDGKGAQLRTGPAPVSWGGSDFIWTPFASLP